MLKLRLMFVFFLTSLIPFSAMCQEKATKKEEIIQLLMQGQIKEASKLVYLDTASFWVLLCTFFISFGMINLSSSIAQSFVGKGGGNDVGKSAQAAVSFAVGAVVGKATKGFRPAFTAAYNSRKAKKLESQKAHETGAYRNGNDSQ